MPGGNLTNYSAYWDVHVLLCTLGQELDKGGYERCEGDYGCEEWRVTVGREEGEEKEKT